MLICMWQETRLYIKCCAADLNPVSVCDNVKAILYLNMPLTLVCYWIMLCRQQSSEFLHLYAVVWYCVGNRVLNSCTCLLLCDTVVGSRVLNSCTCIPLCDTVKYVCKEYCMQFLKQHDNVKVAVCLKAVLAGWGRWLLPIFMHL